MSNVLIISGDVVDRKMGGMGVRYWEIAHALARSCSVTLAVPDSSSLTSDIVRVVPYAYPDESLETLARQQDVIVLQGFVMHFHPYLRDLGIPLAVDLYVPYLLEGLAWHNQEHEWERWIPDYEEYLRVQTELLRAGDFFFCASERQRDYWLGWLHAHKRLNPHTYREDPTGRHLIDVVPFGIPATLPEHKQPVLRGVHPAIRPQDVILLWAGGLWEWLDPLTVIRAVASLAPRYPHLRLVFFGTQHPNPLVKMRMPERAVELAQQLGVLGRQVIFLDWVPYHKRFDYLLESDIGVSAHPVHLETRFSFRTRMLDYLRASLPMVTTEGDIWASWVQEYQLGQVVPAGDVTAYAHAIELLLSPEERQRCRERSLALQEQLTWDRVIEPLRRFCLAPRMAPDKGRYLTEAERIGRDKDAFLAQVIKDKDEFYGHALEEKEKALQMVSSERDRYAHLLEEREALLPSVSIIIVNYNGVPYLDSCLQSLRHQSYPASRYEIIVVDNASQDDSVAWLKANYPEVRVIESEHNLGFAGGNNLGIAHAKGDLLVLLNNDTRVAPDWLYHLVKCAQQHPEAGLINAHLRLFYPQLRLQIESETCLPPADARPLGIRFCEVTSPVPRGVVQYLEGFYGWEQVGGQRFRWMGASAQLGVSVDPGMETQSLQLTIAAPVCAQEHHFTIRAGNHVLLQSSVQQEPTTVEVPIPREVASQARFLLQNTGSVVFEDGSGRDRGTYVQNYEMFFEEDRGQYAEDRTVFAACGASMLMRRSLLQEIGGLDDGFFMYYEDTDLSWRARLFGWQVLYEPEAVVYHVHCGTSEEWSPQFRFWVERNRLFMLFKNASWGRVLKVWGRYVGGTVRAAMQRHPDTRLRLRVLRALLSTLPHLYRQRRWIQSRRRLSPAEVEQLLHPLKEG